MAPGQATKVDQQHTVTVGDHDATKDIIFAISPTAKASQYELSFDVPEGGKFDLSQHQVQENGINKLELGKDFKRGHFEKRQDDEFNPLVFPVGFMSYDLQEFVKKFTSTEASGDDFTFSADNTNGKLETKIIEGHRIITRLSSSISNGFKIDIVARDFKLRNGFPFPGTVILEEQKSGAPFRTTTYTYLTDENPKSYLKLEWKEGAIVKNSDTNEVFVSRNGQLVLDERIHTQSGMQNTVSRLLAIGAIGILVSWVMVRLRRKPNIKV